jgi:thiol-disulfide isomerase/thioredoxin
MGLRVLSRVALPLFVPALACVCLAAEPAAERPAGSVLHLTNGGFVAGKLQGSDDPKALRWSSPLFARPLEFPLSAVNAVHYAVPAQPASPRGEYCFELVDDDVLYGDLRGLTDDEVEIDSPGIGRMHLRREQVRRLYRWKGADSIYLGPNGLAGWKDTAPAPQWRDEGGQLLTEQPGASLFADVGLPEKAVIEVELSWKRRPNFVFALGVAERVETVLHAFLLEVWEGDLVVTGESARDADVAAVQRLEAGEGRVRVRMYLDQKQRRLILLSPDGKPRATLRVRFPNPPLHPGVRLTNRVGDVRLEYLRVSRWNGVPPREVREDQARLHRTDGSIVYGTLAAFDPRAKQFTLRDGTSETLVTQGAVADVYLAPGRAGEKGPADAAAGNSGRTLRLVYRDGSRFSGTPTRIEDTHVTLACPGVTESLRLPLAELRSLIALRHGKGPTTPPVEGRPGRLEADGLHLPGRLVPGAEQPDASCLVWHPDLGLGASPLVPGVSGRIVYRAPPAPAPSVRADRPGAVMGGAIVGGARVLFPANPPGMGGGTVPQSQPARQRSLHLRSGDTIPCEVLGIDEKGVTFKTPLSDATFVAHDRIKSVDLITLPRAPQLDEAKRDRLLTLPRLQKGSPPTHLIYSRNGDFLRGRLLEMDDKRLKVEVRLETRDIPRDRVAQITWLHADELADRKAAPPSPAAARVTRVQTVRGNGDRLTFVAQKADHRTIWGTSEILGACRADLGDVDRLLFGSAIEQEAAELASHVWKLHHAPEPKFAQAEAGGQSDGRSTGMESPLVGQPAFAFRLDQLDGSRFQLADHKGRVVVLDFWATWCGPCLETLPLVEGVVREFAERDVKLIAVNLEEQPEQIKAVLGRHKLKVAVALDRDGAVAAKYTVTAIPQTVVVDRDGKVARLFVGGGKKTAEALRKALQDLGVGKAAPGASP